jgi:hypothetical protein
MPKPVEIEFLMKDNLTPGIDKAGRSAESLSRQTQAGLSEAQMEMKTLASMILSLKKEVEGLGSAGKTASSSMDQQKNIEYANALRAKIADLKRQLVELQNTAENTKVVPPEMSQATQKFNGLNASIQQIAREMPSLAMGPQMFFLAISNNLPIFADEVGRARKEYDELIKTGQKGTPVWKQVLSSLFSWQTALTTGIMLLVMYGGEIVNWAKGVFTAKSNLDDFNISLKEMAEIEADGRAQMVRTRFELDNTIREIKNFNGTKSEEKAKVEELNRKYGESFGYYDSLAQWYDVMIKKSGDYIKMLFMQAKAQALVNKAVEADKEVNDIKTKPDEDAKGAHGSLYRFFAKFGAMHSQGQISTKEVDEDIDRYNARAKATEIKAAEAKRDAYLKEAEELQVRRAKLGKDSDIGGHTADIPKKNGGRNNNRSEQEELEELLALRRKNQRDEIELMEEGEKKRIAQIKQDYRDEIDELDKQKGKWRKAQKGKLTADQNNELSKGRENAQDKRVKSMEEIDTESRKAQENSMREYLKEYGDYQQQKLALAEEYTEKIAKAQKEGNTAEVMRLQHKQRSETAAAEITGIKADIDWQSLFGNFAGLLREQLQPMLDSLKKYSGSEEFKNASVQDKQIVFELIDKLEKEMSGGINGKMFTQVGKDITAYQRSLRDLMDAKEREKEAGEALIKAKEAAKKVESAKSPKATAVSQLVVREAQDAFDSASDSVKELTKANKESSDNLRASSSNAIDSLQNLSDGLQGLRSGSLSGAAQGLGKIGEATKNLGGVMGKVGGTLAKTFSNGGIIGQIISAILSILDVLKDGIGPIISNLIDSILNAVNGIIKNILSLKLFTQIGTSLFHGIRSILDTVSFGLFSSNGNAKEVNQLVNRQTESNKYLTLAIDRLTGEMSSSGGRKAASYYQDAKKKLEEKISNDQQMLEAKMGYHSAHHSNDSYIGYDQWMGDEVKRLTGQTVSSLSDIWKLDPDDLAKLQESTQLWSRLHEGKYDNSEWLDNYVEDAGKLEDLKSQLNETLNQTDFSGFRDSWLSMLTDLDSDNQDLADNFEKYLQKSILNSLMADKYDDELKQLYDAWAEAGMDGEYTEDEIEKLRAWEQGLSDRMLSDRDKFADAYGWESSSTSQTGKSGSFSAMSQDQGTKLEGLFTSGQIHWASIDALMEDVSGKMTLAQDCLKKIEENTGKSAGNLDDIKEDIKRIIRDGIKMK